MRSFRNVSDMKQKVLESPELLQQLQADPTSFFQNVETTNPVYKTGVFLTVVGILGLVLLSALIIGAIITLKTYNTEDGVMEIPDFIVMLGSTAIGALAGLLAPSPRNDT
ncbi:MAG: hypothetical protein R2824_19750 [Saprospiraceae bacterium]